MVALSAFSVSVAPADDFHYKQGASGDWNDASKWHRGTYDGETGTLPGVGDKAYLSGAAGAECTVRIDGDVSVGALYVQRWTGGGTVQYKLTGSGRLTLGKGQSVGFTSLQISAGAALVMDGPDVYVDEGHNYCEGGTLLVRQGTFTPKSMYIKAKPGTLIVDGGTVTGDGNKDRSITLQDGWKSLAEEPCGTIELRSGLLDARCNFKSGWFKMTGGTWDRSRTAAISSLFPTLMNNPIMHVTFGGGNLVTHVDDRLEDDPLYLERLHSVRYTTPDKGVTWTPSLTNGTYGISEIVAPCVYIALTNEVSLSCSLLECRDLAFSGEDVHYVDYNVLTTRFSNLPSHRVGAMAASGSVKAPFHIESRDFLRFESDDPNGDIMMLYKSANNVLWRFQKGFSARTATADGASPVAFEFCSPHFGSGARVEFDGIGTGTLTFASDDKNGNKNIYSNVLDCVRVGGGLMRLGNWSWNQYTSPFRTERLELGDGARVETTAAIYAHMDANEVSWDSSNELLVATPDLQDSDFPPAPIMLGPKHVNDFRDDNGRPNVTLTTDGASGNWNFEWINGQPVIWRKGVSARTTFPMPYRKYLSKWRGTKDGNWSDAGNWLIDDGSELAADCLDQTMAFDGGYANTRISVDSGVQAYQVRVYDRTAPVAFVGKGSIELKGNTYTQVLNWYDTAYAGAITSGSDHPVVFDVPVKATETFSMQYRNLAAIHGGRGYIAFTKQVEGGNVFAIQGDVRVAGNASAQNLLLHEQLKALPSKRTRLSVLPGGSIEATCQTMPQSGVNCDMCIYSNATVTIRNDADAECLWGHDAERTPIEVKRFGLFDCRAPLGGSSKIAFAGEGEVRLADTGTRATSDYPVVFDGVTFAVDRFAAGHPVILKGSPTWASKADWTYSLGEVAMPAGETLTVDTGDLDDASVAHSVRIDSPLVAERVVKAGVGTLTLGSADNRIGALRVDAGTLDISGAQSFGSLDFAAGTALRLGGKDAHISIASGGLDFTRFTIEVAPSAFSGMKSWTTVLTVPEGVAASGTPVFASNVKVRVVEGETGTSYQVKCATGFMTVIR